MRSKTIFFSVIILAGLAVPSCAQKTGIHLLNTFHIASAGGWDYISIQPNSNKLYVSHGTQVNILDKTSGDSLGVILNTTGVHGIAFIPSLNKGFTSNGRLNNITVFDLSTNAVLSQIAVGENPDAIFYDEFSKKIITCNGRSKDLSIVDPVTEKLVATIPVGGKPETAVSNGAGKIYVNIEDKNEIAVIDAVNFTVEKKWPIAPGEAPTGLAYDTKTKRLFAGCGDNKLLMVLDAISGNIIDKINIGDGCDGVAFDPTLQNIYASNGEGTLTIIKEESADKFSVIENIETKRSARTICIDENTHKIYLPAAELKAPDKPGDRPKMIPGTFQVMVLGK
ncbi:MAG: YncE family protein [Ferruginibacter sp.]